jgi:hypothetical protein
MQTTGWLLLGVFTNNNAQGATFPCLNLDLLD